MLGWIALTLMLWLAAALRTISGPRPAAQSAAAPCLDTTNFEPTAIIPAQAGIQTASPLPQPRPCPGWIPAFAGITKKLRGRRLPTFDEGAARSALHESDVTKPLTPLD